MDIDKLQKLAELKEKGILNQEEFNAQKQELLENNFQEKNTKKNSDRKYSFVEIIGILFFALFCIAGYDEYIEAQTKYYQKYNQINNNTAVRNTAEVAKKEIEYHKVSPTTMQKQLNENAARANQQYRGMYVEFEGIVRNIDADGEYFNIDSGGFLSSIQCYIKNEQQKQVLLSKNIGNKVYVKGKISRVGEVLGYSVDVIELK